MQDDAPKFFDVIVIGAGMAGLKCANDLQEAGLNVVVLELKNRIGGRILSAVNKNGKKIDLGASWLHKPENNPLYEKAQRYAELQPTHYSLARPTAKLGAMLMYDKNNRLIPKEKIEAAKKITKKFSEYLDINNKKFQGKKSQQQAAHEFCQENQLSSEDSQFFKSVLELIISSDNGVFPNKISAGENLVEDDEEIKKINHDFIFYPHSYEILIEKLAATSTIILNQTVKAINYEHEMVEIQVSSTLRENKIADTEIDTIYYCRKVFVTLPIGVLQKKVVIFNPPLPTKSLEAIQHMNAGNFKKTVLSFSKPLSLPAQEWLVFLRPDGQYEVMNYASLKKCPGNILVFFTQGELSKRLDRKDSKELVQSLLKILIDVYGEYAIPNNSELEYITSNWAEDPAFYGSYSSPGPKSLPSDHQAIWGPHGNNKQVIIGGEAASPHQDYSRYGTTDGAYLSGEEGAKQFIFSNMSTIAQMIFGMKLPFPAVFKSLADQLNTLIKELGSCKSYFPGKIVMSGVMLHPSCSFFQPPLEKFTPPTPRPPAPIATLRMNSYT